MDRPDAAVSPRRLRAAASSTKASFRIPLENPGDSELRFRRRETSSVELTSESGRVVGRARVSGKVRASGSSEGKLHVELPPSSPPGTYRGSVTVGTTSVPIAFVLPPRRSLVVRPDTVVCEIDRDGTESVDIVLSNDGNVPIDVRHPSAVVLEPRDRSCRILRRALAISDEEKALAPVDALVRAAAESTKADTLLATRIDGAPFVLAPGEVRTVRLTMRLRTTARGVYRARVSIAGTRLRIEVHAHHKTSESAGEEP